MKATYIPLFSSLFLFISLPIVKSQNLKVFVNVKECDIKNTYKGSKIILTVEKSDSVFKSKIFGYGLDKFYDMDDSIKLSIVEKLLSFENDTSLCCLKAENYRAGYIDCTSYGYESKRFNTQIDALYMINKICFSFLTDWYACAPVLYDKETKTEINDRPDLIKEVYKEYKKWYLECKEKAKIGKYFPFNDGRYVWFGGKKSIAPKE